MTTATLQHRPDRRRPEPFSAYTTPDFWDDPYVSARLLACHLDPDNPAASRAPAFIDRSVAWLVEALHLPTGATLLDLGCGPGLYAHRLARRGITVHGIDVSRRSVAYAQSVADRQGLPATFRHGNYLTDDLGTGHDAAILIYEDYCALSPQQRGQLLRLTRAGLRAGGRLLFDVTSSARFDGIVDRVVAEPDLDDGFWAERPYVGIHETWTYPEHRLVLDRYTIEAAHTSREFWNWMHCLTPDQVSSELAAAGFTTPDLYGDVAGSSFRLDAPAFAVVTRRE